MYSRVKLDTSGFLEGLGVVLTGEGSNLSASAVSWLSSLMGRDTGLPNTCTIKQQTKLNSNFEIKGLRFTEFSNFHNNCYNFPILIQHKIERADLSISVPVFKIRYFSYSFVSFLAHESIHCVGILTHSYILKLQFHRSIYNYLPSSNTPDHV